MAGPELAKDKTGVRLQVAHHKTDAQDGTETGLSVFELDGTSAADTSSAFAYNTAVKVASTTATIWVKTGTAVTAVASEGEPIFASTWDHMVVNAGEKISVIGGKATIVPIAG
jgi:hypothetical protein